MSKIVSTKLPPFPVTNPELLTQWHPEKNAGLDPHSITAGSIQKVWWRCAKDPSHEWQAIVCNRARKGKGCPYCARQITDPNESLAVLFPALMRQWHPTKNEGLDPTTISTGSARRVWWRCEVDPSHEWERFVFTRTKDDRGCPYCDGRIASEKNSLATVFPEIASQWHPARNGSLTPYDVTCKSGKKVWWRCATCMYEWSAIVKNRTHLKSLCPLCSKDNATIQVKKNRLQKLEDFLPDYEYDASDGLFLNYEQTQTIFRSYLKIESESKSIDSLFSPRNITKIVYAPYYQRNYVWDKDKASYFIESILIGTEIPPLIFYESSNGYEVIDGRQRFETLKRFHDDQLLLTKKGLRLLGPLQKSSFHDLSSDLQEAFFDTKIRIVKFTVVDELKFDPRLQDMLKKEIFRRYNSGITPLRRAEVEKAIYIHDEPTNYLRKQFDRNRFVYQAFLSLFFSEKDRQNEVDPFTIEKALHEVRFLLISPEMPIMATRRKDAFEQFYSYYVERIGDIQAVYRSFVAIVQSLLDIKKFLEGNGIEGNRYCYECLYWALAVLTKEGLSPAELTSDSALNELRALFQEHSSVFFAPLGSIFFNKEFLARYTAMAEHLEKKFGLSLSPYMRQTTEERQRLRKEMSTEQSADMVLAETFVRIEKTEAIPYTIDDICRLMLRGRFIVRPAYQRGEVINKAKSSAIIESIILGIKLPPLYIYKRDDGVMEVVDGQQRLLSITTS